MALRLATTAQFKKDYRRIKKRGFDTSELQAVIDDLCAQKTLSEEKRDHALAGSYSGFRKCHIRPDWLIVYAVDGEKLILTASRTGTHSDLFMR